MRHNQLTITYSNDEKSMDLNAELFIIWKEFGISKSKFVSKAIEEKILKIKKLKNSPIL